MYRRIIAVYDSCPPDPEIRAARIEAEKLRREATEMARQFCVHRK